MVMGSVVLVTTADRTARSGAACCGAAAAEAGVRHSQTDMTAANANVRCSVRRAAACAWIMFGIIIENLPQPIRIAFLGCGFITEVHSRNLRSFRGEIVCSYASRDKARADAFRARFAGARSYPDY